MTKQKDLKDKETVKKQEKTAKEQDKKQDNQAGQIKELENKLNEEKDKYIRLYAEFDNYRKRTNKEKLDLIETASEDVIKDLLPVLDDFERAIAELKKDDDDAHYKGFVLIYEKLRKILTDKGLKEIEVKKGDTFDPEIHEAVAQIPGEKKMSGKIFDVIEKGYKLGPKIIRYPKVVTVQ